jgi:WD40 repeat protein
VGYKDSTGEVEKTLEGHSDEVRAVAFSPDGRRIASGSVDNTIKMWDVVRPLKVSKWLGNTVGRRVKFREYQEFKASGSVFQLHFSTDGTCLATNRGVFNVGGTAAERQSQEVEALQCLYISDQWIRCGPIPILCLPPGFDVACYVVNKEQLAIGLKNGRVLTFTIDRRSLLSATHS